VNVLRLSILITIPLLISGCASWMFGDVPNVKEVQVQTKAVERTPLNLAYPEPLRSREVKFVVITRENADAVFESLEQRGVDPVVFALTDDGYTQLSLTIAEIRTMLVSQRAIIAKYKDYYEPQAAEK
jgi:hypothetical protein